LCVQKDEVKNTCNGKCHLTKQLEKTEESSEDALVQPENLREALLYFALDNEVVFKSSVETIIQIPHVRQLKGITSIHSIFHPPQVI
jgi:hypothetical protein